MPAVRLCTSTVPIITVKVNDTSKSASANPLDSSFKANKAEMAAGAEEMRSQAASVRERISELEEQALGESGDDELATHELIEAEKAELEKLTERIQTLEEVTEATE